MLVLGALALADLPQFLQLSGAALALLLLVRDVVMASRRPARLRLYAEGSLECASAAAPPASASFSPQTAIHELMHPATLLQATSFLGLTQLRWSDANKRHHACMLFPDRLDADTRHRLRVWLATHRPENPSGALPSGSAP
jgi:hypothetical protein